ncbi:hypothetical protein QBC33DRAFT_562143 [Phialemonium atrogriseum]|uniref:Uncharacterized protein n=1 Tax=Phialemonium atrogriseum TaxID=1093897 RepID=A0AAJ0BTT1_9PEZI|nr:uncharacterized protein QBC33DRAFT_562143 [Phialemonium atrogriseum]KAK1764086.1 hypothetical protein QBC33DRAFT_562143 [Phialemonium atrogriseum]
MQREGDKTDARELDFSGIYVLLAFDDSIPELRGWNHRIDVKYVLDPQSNSARAAFSAVWHAI